MRISERLHKLETRLNELREFELLNRISDFGLKVSSATAAIGVVIDRPHTVYCGLGGIIGSFFLKGAAKFGEYIFDKYLDPIH